MIDFLLLLAVVLSVFSAIAWLYAFRNLTKSYRERADRSVFDVNLQTAILGHLFSAKAVEELGATENEIAFARACLIVGLIAQITFVSLLIAFY